jgi:threonine-phosphate decarboxylase
MEGHPKQSSKRQSVCRIPRFRHGGNIHAFARARGLRPEQVLDFSASINPLGWPRGVAAAYRYALSLAVHYPEPYAGTLTTALARYHNLAPKNLIVGNGSTQLIYLLARVLQSRRVLVVVPSFSEHETAFHLVGAQVSRFFLRSPMFTLSVERLRQRLAEGYDTLVLTNPNSPTGVLIPHEGMFDVVQLCRRLRVRLLVDETFVDWVESDSLKDLAPRQPHLFVLRSLTKFFALPGLRVGYAIMHQRNVKRFIKQIEPWSVNNVAQTVAAACLNDPHFAQRSCTFMARERLWVERQLATIGGIEVFPSRANFLLLRITKRGCTAAGTVHQLARRNILIRDCSNFAGLGKQFIRVAIRQREENRRLIAALIAIVGGEI